MSCFTPPPPHKILLTSLTEEAAVAAVAVVAAVAAVAAVAVWFPKIEPRLG